MPNIARNNTAPSPGGARAVSLILRSLPWAVPLAVLLVALFTLDKVWFAAANVDSMGTEGEFAPQLENLAVEPPVEADEDHSDGSADTSDAGKGAEATPDAKLKPKEKPAAADGDSGTSKADADVSVPAKESESPAPKKTKPATEKPDPDADPSTDVPTDESGTPDTDSSADDPPAKEATDATDDNPPPKEGMSPSEPQSALAERIIVGPIDRTVPDDAVLVDSLAAACQKAVALRVDTVELHFDGDGGRREYPFDVMANQLTIRNGNGFKPTVVFSPSSEDMAQDRQMIRLGTGAVDWQGVNLRFELPEQSAGWSLFRLRYFSDLRMRNSIVTVRTVDESGKPQADVAVFEVENGAGPGEPAATEGTGPHISLQQCVVRGQATIVRTKAVSPFRFACQQCLLITSDRLVDVPEAQAGARFKDGSNEVILEHVTAVVGQGMCRFSAGDASYRPVWKTEFTNSIVYVTDLQAPIIEWREISGIDDIEQSLYVQQGCIYPGSVTLLRINPTGDPSQYMNYEFGQIDDIWAPENELPRFALSWKKEPPLALTEDLQTPTDYTLAEEDNPARDVGDGTPAGVDPDLLPTMPEHGAQRGESVTGPPADL